MGRYIDRALTDMFSLESEVATLSPTTYKQDLRVKKLKKLRRSRPTNLQAYDAYLRGLAYTLKSGGFEPRQRYPGASVS